METPLEIAFRDIDRTAWLERRIRDRVARLEHLTDRITRCSVQVAAPHRHHQTGNAFEIRIQLALPGRLLDIRHRPGDAGAHEDPAVAVRDAFDALERQVKEWKGRHAGRQPAHEAPLQGRVAELDRDAGFGQIAVPDGRLIYFHRNAVVDDGFDALGEGDPVELVVRYGESAQGPQASTVRPIGRLSYVETPR